MTECKCDKPLFSIWTHANVSALPCVAENPVIENEEGEVNQDVTNANLPIRQYLDSNIMPQLIDALE